MVIMPVTEGRSPEQQAYLTSLLGCHVCSQAQRSPKLLTCLHSFCQLCLEAHIVVPSGADGECDSTSSQEGISYGHIACPVCSKQTILTSGGLEAVKDNLWLSKIQDQLSIDTQIPWVLVGPESEKNVQESCQNTESQTLKSNIGKCIRNNSSLTELEKFIGSDNTVPILKGVTCYECRGSKIIEACQDIVNSAEDEDNAEEVDQTMESSSDSDSETRYYCGTCDVILCKLCKDVLHLTHEVSKISDASVDKSEYLEILLSETRKLHNQFQTQLLQLENSSHHLVSACETLGREIEDRAARLCSLIEARKEVLLRELSHLQTTHMEKYSGQKSGVVNSMAELQRVCDYTRAVLSHGDTEDVLHMASELSGSLMSNIAVGRTSQPVEIINLKLDLPDLGREDLYIDKSFGSVVNGVVQCGDAEQLRTFNIDLTWPTGLAITRDHEFVITGKTGAFDKVGKVLFYSKNGLLLTSHELQDSQIPYDTIVSQSGQILVTNNVGEIVSFNRNGVVDHRFRDKFKGTGRITTNSHGDLLLCSTDDHCIHVYDSKGGWIKTIASDETTNLSLSHPHYITTNQHNEIIVSDFANNAVVVMDAEGHHKFTYTGTDVEGGQLKCPSAVCCDSFDNILVADFMNDRIHLVSRSGQFLGYLLTKENGVSCPNFLTMDNDGHLFIGQYGGDINVFQYLSYMKFV